MISVVIPVYNCEKTIKACINSLLKQDIDMEIVVVDNNSTDDTVNIINSYIQKYDFIKLAACAEQGVSSARNTGIRHAAGDYIFFIDGDDTLMPGALSALYGKARETGADICFCNIMLISGKKARALDGDAEDVFVKNGGIAALFYNKLPAYIMYSCFKLYRRDLIIDNNILFDPAVSMGEDLLFNLSAYDFASGMYYLSDALYEYYMKPGGLNLKRQANLIEVKTMLHSRIKEYLSANNQPLDNCYMVLINDIYRLMQNEMHDGPGGIRRVLRLGLVAEILRSGIYKRLEFRKKLFYIFLKLFGRRK